jgi:hypothetical protein
MTTRVHGPSCIQGRGASLERLCLAIINDHLEALYSIKQRHVKHNVSSIDYGRLREVTLDESTGTKDKYYKDTLREVE